MSTPVSDESIDEEPADEPRERRSRLETAAFALVAVAVGTVLVVALAMEGAGGGPDLQLLAPHGAAPGRGMAIRAFLFVPDLAAPAGIRSLEQRIDVVLRDDTGRSVARATLTPSPPGAHTTTGEEMGPPSFGMEGVLDVPADARGRYILHGRARLDDATIARCQSPVSIDPHPRVPTPRGRPMHPLQQLSLFAIEPIDGQIAPHALELRVASGACIVGAACRLLVWVGAPAAAVRIEDARGLRAVEPAAPPNPPPETAETAGIVVFERVLEAPEGEVTLVASRGGVDVGRRRVRLPVLLGGGSLDGALGLLPAAAQPSLRLGAPRAYIIDAFRSARWERTGSITTPTEGYDLPALPFPALDPGLWRVQARTDPFGNDAASVRFAYLKAADETDAHALAQIRHRLLDEGAEDAFTRGLPYADIDPALQAEHALSLLEMDVVPQAFSMSGRLQRESTLDEDRVHVRWLAVAVVLSLALFIVGYMLRRGLYAAREARELLQLAGAPGANSKRNVVAMTMVVLGVVFVVGLSFVSVAILILARGG